MNHNLTKLKFKANSDVKIFACGRLEISNFHSDVKNRKFRHSTLICGLKKLAIRSIKHKNAKTYEHIGFSGVGADGAEFFLISLAIDISAFFSAWGRSLILVFPTDIQVMHPCLHGTLHCN